MNMPFIIEWSEKCKFREWRSHEWNIHFLASRDEINGICIPKNWIFFSLYIILGVTDVCTKWRHTRSHITSYKWWRCIMCNVGQSWNHRSRSRKSENFSKSRQSNYHICPCDPTWKLIPSLCVLSTNKKVTGIWNSVVGSRKSTEKAEGIQFLPWNTT